MQKGNILYLETALDSIHTVYSEKLGGVVVYTLGEDSACTENLMILTVSQAEELRNGLKDALEAEEFIYREHITDCEAFVKNKR
jgi:hypothetical protein